MSNVQEDCFVEGRLKWGRDEVGCESWCQVEASVSQREVRKWKARTGRRALRVW